MRTVSQQVWARLWPGLRLASLIACALIGLSALMTPRGNRPARSLLPYGAAASHPGSAGVSNMTGASAFSGLPPEKAASIMEAHARSPLSFEAREQSPGEYYSRGQGYSLSLTAQEVRLTLRQNRQYPTTRRQIITSPEDDGPPQIESRPLSLTMKLIGADPSSRAKALDPLPGKRNYFLGADPSKWRANVPTFAKLRYGEIYPGIDLVYYGAGQRLEYDFIVAPGADPGKIRLAFEGASGMRIDDNGDLILTTPLGDIRQRRPIIYQETNGGRREVAGKYISLGEGQI